jgi:thioredoxin-related protein
MYLIRNTRVAGFALMTALFAWGTLQAATGRDPYEHFFDVTFGDFAEELDHAREEGKTAILVFFEMDACPFCHRMKQTVLNQPEVQDYYRRHFRIFSVDVEGGVEMTDFEGNPTTQSDWAVRANRVRATPVFQFFDLEGKPIARLTGPTSGVEEFLWLGEYVADGHYQETSFTRYKRDRQEQARRQ